MRFGSLNLSYPFRLLSCVLGSAFAYFVRLAVSLAMVLLYHDSVIFQLAMYIKIALYISAICAVAIVIFMWYNAQYKEVEI